MGLAEHDLILATRAGPCDSVLRVSLEEHHLTLASRVSGMNPVVDFGKLRKPNNAKLSSDCWIVF